LQLRPLAFRRAPFLQGGFFLLRGLAAPVLGDLLVEDFLVLPRGDFFAVDVLADVGRLPRRPRGVRLAAAHREREEERGVM